MKNKKDLLGGVIIISLLLLVLVTYMTFYNYNKDEEKLKEESKLKDNSLVMINVYDDYTTSKIMNKENINNDKVLIGSYNCKSDNCEVIEKDIFDKRYIILKENDKMFIYDFTIGKIMSNYYDEISFEVNDKYYITKLENKYGIISKTGVEIIGHNYDEIFSDSVYDSYIKVKNGKLYGIIDLDNGSIVIDTKYEDIKVSDSKYFSVLKDGLWYVIDNEENIITNGYEDVFAFSKGFIALIDENLNFLKYNKEENEMLISDVIPIYDDYEIKRDGSTIDINVRNQDVMLKYEYIVNRNKLMNK